MPETELLPVTVAHIKWPKMGLDYGFMYEIANGLALADYWVNVRGKHIREGFSDFLKSREGLEAMGTKGTGSIGDHVSTREGQLLAAGVRVEQCKDNPRSVVDVLLDIQDTVYKGMVRALEDKGTIYINGNGGYFFLHPEMEVVERRGMPKYVLPGATIKISQWPGGRHYYAYVGGESVTLYGSNKWGTEREARHAAETWAKQHNIHIQEE